MKSPSQAIDRVAAEPTYGRDLRLTPAPHTEIATVTHLTTAIVIGSDFRRQLQMKRTGSESQLTSASVCGCQSETLAAFCRRSSSSMEIECVVLSDWMSNTQLANVMPLVREKEVPRK
jgi:hypothetical protein